MSLEEMLRDKQYKQGGLETMVGGSTSVTQPVNLDDIFHPDKEQPDWAKPGPRVSKLNPLVPTHNELLHRRQQAPGKPYATVSYQKPGDTFADIRKRMQEKSADPRYGTFLQGNIYQKPLEEQPGFSGFYSAYTMDLPTRFDPETFAKAKEANPLMYNIGRGAGHLAKYATGYGAVGPAIEGIKGLQAIQSPFLRTMATEGAKDLVIGGSIGSLEGFIQGKTPGEIAKDMPRQLAYDALANLVFYGAGKAVKGLRSLKSAQQAAGEAWAKSITMPDGRRITPAQQQLPSADRLLLPERITSKEFAGPVELTPAEKSILNKPIPMKEMEIPSVDKTFDRQYNSIESIKAQLSKYYSGFDDYAHKEALEYASSAIKDLQETERSLSGARGAMGGYRGPAGSGIPKGEWSGAGRTIGQGFSQNLIDTGRVNLTGTSFNSIDELATIAQVYRDPRFETFRVLYTQGDTIVGTEAVSSRLPSMARAFIEDKQTGLSNIQRRMKSFNADGYYLLHNHPAGSMKPSSDDLNLTQVIANNIPGFKSHIIINSNKYTQIYPGGILNGQVQLFGNEGLPLNLGQDRLLQASIPHQLIGAKIANSTELANIAKKIQLSDDISVAFFVTGGGSGSGRGQIVQAIMEIDNRFINANPVEFANFLKNRAIDYGGSNVFLSLNGKYDTNNIVDLIQNGYVTDAINIKNGILTHRDLGITPSGTIGKKWMGVDIKDAAWRVDAVKRQRNPNAIMFVPDESAMTARNAVLDRQRQINEAAKGKGFWPQPESAKQASPFEVPQQFRRETPKRVFPGELLDDMVQPARMQTGASVKAPAREAMGTLEDMSRSPRPLSNLAKPGAEAVGTPVRRSDIIKMIDEQLDVPVRTGRFRQRAYGIYKVKPEVIRLKSANDIYTLAHEVGHHLDNKLGLGGLSKVNAQFNDELLTLGRATSRSSYSPAQVRAEGVAEFMRYYLLDPEQARKLAPNYFNAFETRISNTGAKDVLDNVRQQVNAFVTQSPTQRVLGQISTSGQPREQMTLDKIYAKTFDELQPLKRAVQDMTGGTDMPITKDPFRMAELHRGWVGKAETYLHYGIVDDSFNKVGKSLDEIIKPISDRLDDFRAYSVSKRALELADRGIETGISVDDAVATIRQLNTPEFQKAFTELVGYQNSILNQLVKSGVLSGKDAATIRALNQNYVPFYRLFDEAGGGLGRNTFANLPSPIKAIKGSSRDIVDPIESIIKNTYVITNIAERNRIGKALVELAESTPGAGRWAEKVATPMFGSSFQLDEIAKALRDAGVDTSAIDLEHVATIFRPSIFAPGKENIVTVFRNGKREFWQLQPDLYRAMLALDKKIADDVIKLVSYPTRILRAGATLNPEFMARNPLRDAFTAYVYSKYGFIPGVDTARGLFHVLKKDDLYWKWKAAGGSHGALVSLDRNYLQASIRSITERSLKDKTLNIIRNPIEGLRVLSEFTEEATRVAEFAKGLKKEGMTRAGIMKAAAASRDVTLDFARAGTASKEINKIVAFFNAALQGTDKLARQFMSDPVGSTVKAVTSITLPSIVLYYVNHDNPKYQELPQWQKDFFWIIPVRDKFYRIPKPFELGIIFGTLPERMLEFAKTNDRKAFDEYGANLLEAGAPSVVPTAMLPLLEAWANKSYFTELPIVPQSEEQLPKPLQYGPYTSETAKALGRLFDISPRIIDNTIRGYSAGLGTYATKGLDLLLTGTGAVTPTPKPSTYEPDVPVAKAFQVRTFGQSKSVDEFYTELEKLEGLYSGVRKRFNVPAGTTIKLEELMEIARTKDIGMKPEDIEKLIIFRKARTEFSDLRQLKANVERDNKLTTAEKRDISTRIDERMTDIARVLMGKKPMGGNR
jgi:hypothetical protein